MASRPKRLRCVAVGALWLAACATAGPPRPLPAGHTLFPGTGIALALPAGFHHDAELGAWESEDERTAIFVSELPGSVYATLRSFSGESFQRSGMRLEGHERVTVDGWPARLYRAKQAVRGGDLSRWVLVFGDSSTSVVVTAVTPEPGLGPALVETLLSARWQRRGLAAGGGAPGA